MFNVYSLMLELHIECQIVPVLTNCWKSKWTCPLENYHVRAVIAAAMPCKPGPIQKRQLPWHTMTQALRVLHNPSASGDCYQPLSAMQHDSLACIVAPLRDCLGSSLISGTVGFNFIIRSPTWTPEQVSMYATSALASLSMLLQRHLSSFSMTSHWREGW